MTTILTSLLPVPVEVTYDPAAAFVALKVYAFSGGSWTQEGSAVPAVQVGDNSTWMAIYKPLTANPYLFELMAYTDDTYATPNENYAASSRSFVLDQSIAQALLGKSDLIGIIEDEDSISC